MLVDPGRPDDMLSVVLRYRGTVLRTMIVDLSLEEMFGLSTVTTLLCCS